MYHRHFRGTGMEEEEEEEGGEVGGWEQQMAYRYAPAPERKVAGVLPVRVVQVQVGALFVRVVAGGHAGLSVGVG